VALGRGSRGAGVSSIPSAEIQAELVKRESAVARILKPRKRALIWDIQIGTPSAIETEKCLDLLNADAERPLLCINNLLDRAA